MKYISNLKRAAIAMALYTAPLTCLRLPRRAHYPGCRTYLIPCLLLLTFNLTASNINISRTKSIPTIHRRKDCYSIATMAFNLEQLPRRPFAPLAPVQLPTPSTTHSQRRRSRCRTGGRIKLVSRNNGFSRHRRLDSHL